MSITFPDIYLFGYLKLVMADNQVSKKYQNFNS